MHRTISSIALRLTWNEPLVAKLLPLFRFLQHAFRIFNILAGSSAPLHYTCLYNSPVNNGRLSSLQDRVRANDFQMFRSTRTADRKASLSSSLGQDNITLTDTRIIVDGTDLVIMATYHLPPLLPPREGPACAAFCHQMFDILSYLSKEIGSGNDQPISDAPLPFPVSRDWNIQYRRETGVAGSAFRFSTLRPVLFTLANAMISSELVTSVTWTVMNTTTAVEVGEGRFYWPGQPLVLADPISSS